MSVTKPQNVTRQSISRTVHFDPFGGIELRVKSRTDEKRDEDDGGDWNAIEGVTEEGMRRLRKYIGTQSFPQIEYEDLLEGKIIRPEDCLPKRSGSATSNVSRGQQSLGRPRRTKSQDNDHKPAWGKRTPRKQQGNRVSTSLPTTTGTLVQPNTDQTAITQEQVDVSVDWRDSEMEWTAFRQREQPAANQESKSANTATEEGKQTEATKNDLKGVQTKQGRFKAQTKQGRFKAQTKQGRFKAQTKQGRFKAQTKQVLQTQTKGGILKTPRGSQQMEDDDDGEHLYSAEDQKDLTRLITRCTAKQVSSLGNRQVPLHNVRNMFQVAGLPTLEELQAFYQYVPPQCYIYEDWLRVRGKEEKDALRLARLRDYIAIHNTCTPGLVDVPLAWRALGRKYTRLRGQNATSTKPEEGPNAVCDKSVKQRLCTGQPASEDTHEVQHQDTPSGTLPDVEQKTLTQNTTSKRRSRSIPENKLRISRSISEKLPPIKNTDHKQKEANAPVKLAKATARAERRKSLQIRLFY